MGNFASHLGWAYVGGGVIIGKEFASQVWWDYVLERLFGGKWYVS